MESSDAVHVRFQRVSWLELYLLRNLGVTEKSLPVDGPRAEALHRTLGLITSHLGHCFRVDALEQLELLLDATR